jgi:hypothetical protein
MVWKWVVEMVSMMVGCLVDDSALLTAAMMVYSKAGEMVVKSVDDSVPPMVVPMVCLMAVMMESMSVVSMDAMLADDSALLTAAMMVYSRAV